MSAIGWSGRELKITLDGVVIAAVRTKSVAFTRNPIDATEGEKHSWRYLLPEVDSTGVEVSVDGVCSEENFQVLMDEWYGNEFSNVGVVHPDGSVQIAEDGAFLLSLEHSGESGGYVSFAAVFQFSGLVEVVPPVVLTSELYPLESIDAISPTGEPILVERPPVVFEGLDLGGTVVSGILNQILLSYPDGEPEALDIGGSLIAGDMFAELLEYADGEPEALDINGTLLSGTLELTLVSYTTGDPEALDVSGSLVSGEMV